jgi:hypothetical protein
MLPYTFHTHIHILELSLAWLILTQIPTIGLSFIENFFSNNSSACSLGLSATSQQYFSLRTNQPPATSRNQPAVLFSQNKPAPAISHQPTE